ncbi:hypothetical protein EDB19DRAFT_1623851 [Suillus lakei]|nr:hypothetical protein EDB19DRAFT_1623851 [Suillus lakei]
MGRKKKVEQEVYHVEVITKARVSDEGDWEYYVKWAGYDSDADTWEPQQNVKQCDRLLCSFWDHIGTDDGDYPVGYEIAARDHWISETWLTFCSAVQLTLMKSKRRSSLRRSSQKTQSAKKVKAPEPKQVESDTDSSEESDIPLKQKAPVAKALAPRGKKRANSFISSDVCHSFFIIVLRSLDDSRQTLMYQKFAH